MLRIAFECSDDAIQGRDGFLDVVVEVVGKLRKLALEFLAMSIDLVPPTTDVLNFLFGQALASDRSFDFLLFDQACLPLAALRHQSAAFQRIACCDDRSFGTANLGRPIRRPITLHPVDRAPQFMQKSIDNFSSRFFVPHQVLPELPNRVDRCYTC